LSLNLLPDGIQTRTSPYTLRREVVLWNWLTFLLFVVDYRGVAAAQDANLT